MQHMQRCNYIFTLYCMEVYINVGYTLRSVLGFAYFTLFIFIYFCFSISSFLASSYIYAQDCFTRATAPRLMGARSLLLYQAVIKLYLMTTWYFLCPKILSIYR